MNNSLVASELIKIAKLLIAGKFVPERKFERKPDVWYTGRIVTTKHAFGEGKTLVVKERADIRPTETTQEAIARQMPHDSPSDRKFYSFEFLDM